MFIEAVSQDDMKEIDTDGRALLVQAIGQVLDNGSASQEQLNDIYDQWRHDVGAWYSMVPGASPVRDDWFRRSASREVDRAKADNHKKWIEDSLRSGVGDESVFQQVADAVVEQHDSPGAVKTSVWPWTGRA